MKYPAAGIVAVALAGAVSADRGWAQPAADARQSRAQAAGLVSIPVSRRTTTRQIPYGTERIEDTVSYSVVPYNWQGFYIGLHGGGAWGRTRSDNTSPFGGYDAGVPRGYALAPAGVFGGGQFGAIAQRGNWVFGAEVDFGYLGLDRTLTAGDDRTSVRYQWYGTLTGRVGFAWDHALYYLKAGGALARIRNTASDLDGAPPAIDPSDLSQVTRTHVGWAIGGGLEYGVAPNWSAKIEYLYMDFGSAASGNLDGDTFRHDNSVHTVKLGLNYRFGGVPLFIRF
jgi:outer membrane immunogenic protein